MKVLLIAGHGQGDPGACGCGYAEADLTREMVSLVREKLEPYTEVTVADTALNWFKNKSKLPLSDVDYALEIHFNAGANNTSGNGITTGTEIYVTKSEKGTSVEQTIINGIAALGFKNRGVKRYNWSVINYIKNKGISAALLETCFIDDLDDMNIYISKKDGIAEAIVKGIVSGFSLSENSDTKEDEPMTKEERTKFNELVNAVSELTADVSKLTNKMIYNYIDDNMPEFARPTIRKLTAKGYLNGEGDGLNLDYNMLRILSILDRAGAFGE